MEKLLSVPELLGKGFDMYRQKWWTLAGISLINVIPYAVFSLLLIPFIGGAILFHYQNHWPSWLLFLACLMVIVFAGAIWAMSAWSMTAIILAINDKILQPSRAYLHRSMQLLWPAFWVSVLVSVALLIGFILLVIPGIIFAVWFAFSLYLLVNENATGIKTLEMSKRLTKGYWWQIFGRLALLWLIFVIAAATFKPLGGLINIFIVTPFSLCYLSVLYENLKQMQRTAV